MRILVARALTCSMLACTKRISRSCRHSAASAVATSAASASKAAAATRGRRLARSLARRDLERDDAVDMLLRSCALGVVPVCVAPSPSGAGRPSAAQSWRARLCSAANLRRRKLEHWA